MAKKLWGEIETQPIELIIPDIEQIIDLTMQPDFLEKTVRNVFNENETETIKLPPADSRILYARDLHNYSDTLRKEIEDTAVAVEYGIVSHDEPEVFEPPQPLVAEPKYKVARPVNYVEKDYSDFSLGLGPDPPELSENVLRRCLAQSIAALLVHIGYQKTQQSTLDVFVDVVDTFLSKLCRKLNHSHRMTMTANAVGFADTVDRTFNECGLGGIRGVCEFYHTRVIKYQEVLEERSKRLLAERKPANSFDVKVEQPSPAETVWPC